MTLLFLPGSSYGWHNKTGIDQKGWAYQTLIWWYDIDELELNSSINTKTHQNHLRARPTSSMSSKSLTPKWLLGHLLFFQNVLILKIPDKKSSLKSQQIWGFPHMGVALNGWFIAWTISPKNGWWLGVLIIFPFYFNHIPIQFHYTVASMFLIFPRVRLHYVSSASKTCLDYVWSVHVEMLLVWENSLA